MLVRGETTEDRIAKIAQGFGQGIQNFQQGQNQKLAQANQAEATRRQQALDAQNISNNNEDRVMRREQLGINKDIAKAKMVEDGLPFEQTKEYQKAVAIGKAREEIRIDSEDRAAKRKKEEQKFEAVDSIRKELNTFKPSKDMQDVDVALSKIMSAPASAAGDMSLIYGQMKIFDPGTGVKEGEYATAENARGMDSSLLASYNKVLNGQRLTPAQREDFKKTAVKLAHSQYKNFQAASAPQRNRLKELGVDEKQVLPTFSQQNSYDNSSREESEIARMNELRAKRIGGV